MKVKCLAVVIFSFFTCTSLIAAPSQVPNNLLLGWNTIQSTSLKSDIKYLTSDALQGRLSLTTGDNQAIQWIAAQFKKSGLLPVANNSYLQAVPLIEYIPDKKNSYIELTQAGQTKRWKKPDVSADFVNDVQLNAPIVFAGYGITAPELNYDDYQNIDVHGKIVMVFEHEPQETNPHSVFNGIANTVHATSWVKIINAQRHGAIAIIIAPEPNRKHPSNQDRLKRIGNAISSKLPSQILADDVHIPTVLVNDSIAKQIAGQLNLVQLQNEIDKNLQPQSRLIPETQMTIRTKNLSRRTATTYNVVGLLEGSDPQLKQETIIVSAHHDHDGIDGKRIWHGADDNASGTVGVVTLAEAFAKNIQAQSGLRPKRSIMFVVFAAEERGLLGAFYMAAHPLRPLATTRAMINFDMIGRNETASNQTDGLITIPKETANRLNLIGSHYSPDYDRIVTQQNHLVGLNLDHRFDNEHALNIFFRSDQFPFVLHQIPAFWWFTGFHPDYHHTSDTAEKINYQKMQKILRLSYLSTYAFANGKQKITFINNPGA